ncbi:MAG: hypothetical protein WC551_11325 [Patescibacteria group bacterium]
MSITAETITLTAFGALYFLTGVFAAIIWRNLVGQIAKLESCKVDKEIYDQAQMSLINDVRDLKKGQDEMAETLDDIRLSLARAEGAREEKEKIKQREREGQ